MQSVELNFVDSCSRQFLRNKDNTWLTKAEPKLTLTSTVRPYAHIYGYGTKEGAEGAAGVWLWLSSAGLHIEAPSPKGKGLGGMGTTPRPRSTC